MSALTIGLFGTSTISQSETDSVLFVGTGTLNITGTAQNPIAVTLSQVAGSGLLDTINISYADVTLGGVAGLSALVNYNIGAGSTLRVLSSVGIVAGTVISFTAINSHLVIGSGVNLSQLGGIKGFGAGSNIDLTSAGFASYSYSDNTGTGTGGTLTLRDSNGTATGTVVLTTGEFTAASFNVHTDGSSGTLVDFATYVSSISATPPNSDLTVGGNVVLRLGTTAPVTITGGTPTLTLNDGGIATYDAAHSSSTNLVFNYTVLSGQNTPDLAISGANLNGASVTDLAGSPVSLSGAVGNPAGTLQIDTTAPTITSISTTPGSGSLAAGQVVAISLTSSEAVAVSGGTPTLTLNDGRTATYDAVHSTATNLVFNYTVQAGDNTADLTVTGSNLNGATITDPAGNAANLAGAVGNPPGILQIDTTPATITAISTTPGSGSLAAGQVVAISLTSSEAVAVSGGTPTLTLNDGRTATYDAVHSTATNLVFNYTVQAGDNTADLTVTGSNLNGATITDPAGNAANLAGAVGNPPGILQIDTTPATITAISTTPGSGSLAAGQVVAISLTSSEAVAVSGGTPTLTLNDGRTATYDPNSSTATNLVFKYVVQPGDTTADLTVTGSNLNGATITDPAGNAANLAGAVGNPPGILQIDTARPPVTSVYGVTTTPGSGDLGAGSIVSLQVTLTGNSTVSGGTPTLALSDGGIATYDPASSTSTSLIFRHTIQSGQNTPDLAVTAVSLNGATVVGTSGTAVDLSGAVVNPGGILQVDTTAPTTGTVTTTPGSGSFGAGQIIAFDVPTSEAVTVSGGTPTLTLNDGGTATYAPTSSTATNLVFKYTVQPGQNIADLTVTASNLNGAAIADGAGNALNLSSSVGNPAGTLQIDTTSPTVIAVAFAPGFGTVTEGQVVAIDVTSSEAIRVSGGTPTLMLNDGGTAIYDAANSTSTLMVFDYTVLSGQNTPDLTVTGSNLNGATITDPAGNPLNLSGAVGNPPGVLQVSTVPVVTTVTATPANGDLMAGGAIVIEVSTSGPTTITGGTPMLALSDGGRAVYDARSSTPTMLVFRNTVQAGQNTPDLSVLAVFLNGAVITDGAGRTVSLAGAIGNPAGVLQIDTIRPTALSITESGSLEPGGVFTITTTFSEAVLLTGTTRPMFMLSNGAVAGYNTGLSTPTMAVFTYAVQPGDDVTNLVINGFNPNDTVAADAAGNLLDDGSVGAALAAAQGNFSDATGAISPTTIDVYRFFDTKTGTHFYTTDQNERQTILTTRPDLVPEGPNGVGLVAVNPTSNDPNKVPVYRFFDLKQGTQFLTASTSERDTVIATRPDLVYEPSSIFYEHTTQQAGDTAVYRFFDTKFGTHFYTDDATERSVILQTRPDLVQEGVGFYEPMRNPAA